MQELGHAVAGVLHPYERGLDRVLEIEAVVNEHNARLGIIDILDIFRVGKERDRAWHAFLYLRESVNGGIFIAFYSSLNKLGYLFCREFHVVVVLKCFCKNNELFSNCRMIA